jgi:hypothetical protein
LQTLLYGWAIALRDLWRIICELLKQWWHRFRHGTGPTPRTCVPINDPASSGPIP